MPAMLSMGMGNKAPAEGLWAADNGRFNNPEGYTDEKYLDFLARHRWAADRCIFATAPDVVGDAAATLAMSQPMFARIREAGYKVAYVAQDGILKTTIPWDEFDAIFIGGTTDWKLSEEARVVVMWAKAKGKWTHMGRVNSFRRIRLAHNFGCDSVDGTYIAFGPDVNEPKVRAWLDQLDRQQVLLS